MHSPKTATASEGFGLTRRSRPAIVVFAHRGAAALRGINPPVARVRSLFGDDEPVRQNRLLTRYFNGHTFPCFQ